MPLDKTGFALRMQTKGLSLDKEQFSSCATWLVLCRSMLHMNRFKILVLSQLPKARCSSWVPSHRLVRSVTLAGLLVPAMTLGVNGEVSLMLNIHCSGRKGIKHKYVVNLHSTLCQPLHDGHAFR